MCLLSVNNLVDSYPQAASSLVESLASLLPSVSGNWLKNTKLQKPFLLPSVLIRKAYQHNYYLCSVYCVVRKNQKINNLFIQVVKFGGHCKSLCTNSLKHSHSSDDDDDDDDIFFFPQVL